MRYYRVSQRCRERGATSSPLRRGEGSSKFGGGGGGGCKSLGQYMGEQEGRVHPGNGKIYCQ